MHVIKFSVVRPMEGFHLDPYPHGNGVGFVLKACDELYTRLGAVDFIRTGVAVDIPPPYFATLAPVDPPRGWTFTVLPSLIYPHDIGEILVPIVGTVNRFCISPGMAVALLVPHIIPNLSLQQVATLNVAEEPVTEAFKPDKTAFISGEPEA